ncbi:dual specificity phosphatase Yvh1 [Penicillium psychrosexuale]|uniref:dual specificity phosphatase Yvh1 n=1 Tax=Penicillium psychrosexuale TaxID=1002107 RepID=UPI00254576D0|nr:dual specificity phosphatase Yvh1 [Penicillium psychrosexuale]KAJ5784061.1 dual specificity phosphatase Yvh1 [Penicillium psychrosexuale]
MNVTENMSENITDKDIQNKKDKQIEREKKLQKAFEPWMIQIVPGLILGNASSSWNTEMLVNNRVKSIISLSQCPWGEWSQTRTTVPRHHHKMVRAVDTSTQDLLIHMSDTRDFIDKRASSALLSVSSLPVDDELVIDDEPAADYTPEAILVHCDFGISRTPTIIIAYIMRKLRIPPMEALEFIKSKQKVKPNANFTRQLQVWDEVGYQVWEDEEKTVPKLPYKAFLEDRAAFLKENWPPGENPFASLTLLN